jgi:hypothetical protein
MRTLGSTANTEKQKEHTKFKGGGKIARLTEMWEK